MQAIDYILESGAAYEPVHQLVFHSLLKYPGLSRYFFNLDAASVVWETKGRLFPLKLEHNGGLTFIDIYLFDHLPKKQLEKQLEYVKDNKWTCYYILLGTSWFEYEDSFIRKISDERAAVLGYGEVLPALRGILSREVNLPSGISELASSYKKALEEQRNIFIHGLERKEHDRIFYYSLFYRFKQALTGMECRISSLKSSSGDLFIFSPSDRLKFIFDGNPFELYIEIINDKLYFRISTEVKKESVKHRVKEALMMGIHKTMDRSFVVFDDGKQTGENSSICHIGYDFSVVSSLNTSVEIIRKANNLLPLVIRAAGSEPELQLIQV